MTVMAVSRWTVLCLLAALFGHDMKILIAHQSTLLLARWRHQVATLAAGIDILQASTLTDTYHLAEHQMPDCVVIDEAMANRAEFELLASLFGILNIACVIVSNDVRAAYSHPLFRGILIVPEQALNDEVKKSIQHAKLTVRSVQTNQQTSVEHPPLEHDRLILIGSSTGGIDALMTVTQHFDQHSPPTLIVQHTGGRFSKSLIRLLNAASPATVRAAENGMPLEHGHIYLAPNDQAHLMLAPQDKPHIALQRDAAVTGHRPSVDALFKSALPFAAQTSAALLTGMGKDGAAGLTRLRAAGAHTIAQDPRTSVVYGMPRVAMEMGGVCVQLSIEQIGPALLKSCLMKGCT